MILITIDNNKDFMRIRMNRSKAASLRPGGGKKSWLSRLFGIGSRSKTPLMPSVLR
ncbi:MAG: hypothetical protein WC604_04305 [Candidatus Gracilibacteria bacterium]